MKFKFNFVIIKIVFSFQYKVCRALILQNLAEKI